MNAADRDAALVHQYGPGMVVMEECPICGTLWWKSTHTGAPNGVQVTVAEGNAECLCCAEAFWRGPELFNWVIRVVSNTVRRAPFITVRSHWNNRDRVIVVMPDGQSVTVVAADLAAAIGKASGGP